MNYCLLLLTLLLGFNLYQLCNDPRRRLETNIFDKSFTLPLRGICTILVITGHLENYLDASSMGNSMVLHYLHWSTQCVSVFFFLSGYGIMKSQMKNTNYRSKLIRTGFVKLYKPLIVTSALYCILLCFIDYSFISMIWNQIKGLNGLEIIPHSWYIYVLSLMYLLFYLSFNKAFSRTTSVVCLFVLTALYVAFIYSNTLLHFDAETWTKALWALPIGVLVAINEKQIIDYITKHVVVVHIGIIAFIFTLILLAKVVAFSGGSEHNLFYHINLNLIGFYTYIICIYLHIPTSRITRCFAFIGTIAIETYLAQGLAQSAYLHWLDNKYLYITLNYVTTITLGYILHLLLNPAKRIAK